MNGNGKEYALAIFGIALEKDSLKEMSEDLNFVKDAIDENPEYLDYLVNPAIPKSERLNSISEVFSGRVCEDVYSTLCVLCDHGDMYILNDAISEFNEMYEDYTRYAKATITSAVELTNEQKNKLVSKISKLTNKRIEAEYIVDKSIMGGLTVMVDGKYYDGSVRKNLNNLKEVLS